MSDQIKMVPSLVLATFLAGVVSTVTACVAARAADNCLNEPRHYAPPGSHWYYRLDGPNHRKCWFLGDEGRHVSQAGSPRPSASSSPPPLPQQTATTIQPSLTDAHAEMPIVTTPTEQPQWSSSTRSSNPEKITEVLPDASPSETLSPPSARDPKGESRVMRNGVIDGQSRTESRTELLPAATDREPAAELSAEETSADPLRVRLALLLIVLGLSTIAGCLIFRPSASVQAGRRDVFSSR
jgi:hypothetical protein